MANPNPEIKKYEQLTEAEFELIVTIMRAKRDAASIRAAFLVLTKNTPAYIAYRREGSSESNVCDSVKRILARHHEITAVYGRFTPPDENAVWEFEARIKI